MADLTYDVIKPLIAHEAIEGRQVRVLFRCPVSGSEVPASAAVQGGVGSRAKSAVKQTMMRNLRYGLSSFVRSLVGGGRMGSMASSAVSSASRNSGSAVSCTEDERRAAVLQAFKSVRSRFAWDQATNRFVDAKILAELMTEFSRLTASVQIVDAWDRMVLARMLTEIAASDGTIGDEERGFFEAFAGAGVDGADLDLDDLLSKPPLTAQELASTSKPVRPVLLMLATAVAYSDEQMTSDEGTRLMAYAQGLQVRPEQAHALFAAARDHVLDQLLMAVYADGVADPAERQSVVRLAARLQVDEPTLVRMEGRTRRRMGIA